MTTTPDELGAAGLAPEPAPPGVAHPRPPTPRAPTRRGWRPSNLALRLLTSAVLVPPLLWICYQGGLAFVALIIALSAVGVNEFYNFISEKGATPHRLLGTLAAALLPIIVYLGSPLYATHLLTAVLLTTMVLQLSKREIREAIASVSATFFGVFYVGWLLAHAVSVRFIHGDLLRLDGAGVAALSPEIGLFFTILCLGASFGCDAGAYFVGRRYGRRRLAPAISPNKTVEGALGGVLIGGVVAVGVKLFFDAFLPETTSSRFPLSAAAGFGIALACAGTLGDLIESLLKRDARLKDAGRLLPGVGGVLDRIDSVLLAFPVMYYLLLAYYLASAPGGAP